MNVQLSRHDRRRLQALLRQNLGAFTERCFNELHPTQPYEHNWHLDAIAHHLTGVANGDIKRLIITIQPRSLKSLSATVAFPAWMLGHDPSRRIVAVSYGRDLTTPLANNFRIIMNARWYRELFPWTRLDPRKDTEQEVRTTVGGYRLATTVGGALTGRGGSIFVIDDPMKAADAHSQSERNRVKAWADGTLMSRLDDKRDGAFVLVMQRLHTDDLAGHFIGKGGWTHLDLPAIAPDAADIPIGGGRVHHREAGDLLHPSRDTQEILDGLRRDLGTMAFSAQYLQRPVPVSGNMVKWEWFRRWDRLPERGYQVQIVQSWDTASKAAELNDYSVGITAMVEKNTVYILDVVRVRMEYPDLKKKIISLHNQWKADKLLIEDKGSGTSLIQDLRRDQIYGVAIKPEADKVVRMWACSAVIEDGAVLVPQTAPWLPEFQSELLAFPVGVHDDQVDALSQLINWTRNRSGYTLDNV